MLIGLLRADEGEIVFDGRDITAMSDENLTEVRRRIAYLFQGAALFDSLSVGDNVAYGLREQFWNTMTEEEIEARVAQSLGMVGLPGIEAMRPSDLSGGMKKRVGLARTLAHQYGANHSPHRRDPARPQADERRGDPRYGDCVQRVRSARHDR
jgi:phospholipid/cholesterol/gamma-HCH transport system ATP-binding protein